jgi:hypothetical protein
MILCHHSPQGLRKTTEILSEDSWCPSEDLNWAYPKASQKLYHLDQLCQRTACELLIFQLAQSQASTPYVK